MTSVGVAETSVGVAEPTEWAEPADAAPSAEPRPRRRRRVRVLAACLTVAALLITLGALVIPSAVAVGRAQVLLDARPFACTSSADVTTSTTGDGLVVPAVRLHPGLACRFSIFVRNDGEQDVAVDRIAYPMLGRSNGWGVHADLLQQQGVEPSGRSGAPEDGVDAVFDYEHDRDAGGSFHIGPGETQRFVVVLSWSGGCMTAGSSVTFTAAPVVTVSAGLVHGDLRAAGPGYAFLGGKDTTGIGCGASG